MSGPDHSWLRVGIGLSPLARWVDLISPDAFDVNGFPVPALSGRQARATVACSRLAGPPGRCLPFSGCPR